MATSDDNELDVESGQPASSGWESVEDAHSVTSRERIRRQLNADIEAFLARGGQIQHLDPHMRAESSLEVGDGDGSLL